MGLDFKNFPGGEGSDEVSHGQIFSWIRAWDYMNIKYDGLFNGTSRICGKNSTLTKTLHFTYAELNA